MRAVSNSPGGTLIKRQIVGLDVIRSLAALLVLTFHWTYWMWRGLEAHPTVPQAYARFAPLTRKGWVGVEIFFVLSGFVIAYSVQGATPSRFLQHRLNRLVPGALVCASLTAALKLIVYPWPQVFGEWLRGVSFFPIPPWIDGSYWTLPIELAFYTLVLVNLLIRKGRYLAGCMAVLGCVSAAACCLLLSTPGWLPASAVHFLLSTDFPPGACLLLLHGTFFALGVFLYLLLVQGYTPTRLLLSLVCCAGGCAEIIWHDRGAAFSAGDPPGCLVPLVLWLGSVVLLIASVRWNAALQLRAGPLGMRLIRNAGLATYPLYLLHAVIGEYLIRGMCHRIGYGLAFVTTASFLLLLAGFVALTLEPAVRRRFQRIWQLGPSGS